jgi:hypothetical protein
MRSNAAAKSFVSTKAIPPGLLGERAEAVLREPRLPGSDCESMPKGLPSTGAVICISSGPPALKASARIDGVDRTPCRVAVAIASLMLVRIAGGVALGPAHDVERVVVDAFAEPHDRLAAAVQAADAARCALQGPHRRAGVVNALEVRGVPLQSGSRGQLQLRRGRSIAGVGSARSRSLCRSIVSRRSSVADRVLRPAKRSTASSSRRRSPVKPSVASARPPWRRRGDVVPRHVELDELAGELPHLSGSPRVGMQLVEDDGEDAAANPSSLVATSCVDRARSGRAAPCGRGNPDLGEHGDLLAHAFLEHLEVVAGEAGDDLPRLVGDERLHLDVVDVRRERRWLAAGQRGRRCGVALGSAGSKRRRAAAPDEAAE